MPYKDKKKARECGRRSARKHREKRRTYYAQYIADPANHAKKQAYTREYESKPEVIEAKHARGRRLYLEKREEILARTRRRRKDGYEFVNHVALQYGCQNPDCAWKGELKPHQLDFHHLDPATKVKEIAKMVSYSKGRLVEEINKCVVLCKNCHADVHHGNVSVNESMLCRVDLL